MNNLTPNMLIVDDEPNMREMLRLAMEQERYRCLCVADGDKALTLLEQEPVALALLDINLPGMNGIELLLQVDLVREIERGGLLHDIGKIGTRDAILAKAGKLTKAEFAEVKEHAQRREGHQGYHLRISEITQSSG